MLREKNSFQEKSIRMIIIEFIIIISLLEFSTKMALTKMLDEGDISQSEVRLFYEGVRSFYVTAMNYAINNLPMKDELLKNAQFLNFSSRDSSTFSQVEYFVQRYTI